jgi:hypothetical protein
MFIPVFTADCLYGLSSTISDLPTISCPIFKRTNVRIIFPSTSRSPKCSLLIRIFEHLSFEIQRLAYCWKSTDVSLEHIAYISKAEETSLKKAASRSCWFHTWLALPPWMFRRHASPKHRLTFTGLHGLISQEIGLFVVSVVRTSNPVIFCILNGVHPVVYRYILMCGEWPSHNNTRIKI